MSKLFYDHESCRGSTHIWVFCMIFDNLIILPDFFTLLDKADQVSQSLIFKYFSVLK